ncbi:DUF4097 family beta strand repeat-containing protein [Lactococcus insecticola]|uniref:DUF4097 domain-containing protein n=1 Tax=Pseudolactococcus insecticola TaxID=2709158 RepID=A0A6A0B9U9_9LACT|nr:DUF4097 family beta strand repeat-containing protein [Lactococcus insecticola]GFH41218.1 DUF4097 domain-containing protein [Lactococcus insecticola]
MNDQKERILELMRKNIITQAEAIELLEKAGLSQDQATDASSKSSQSAFDKDGYQTDSSETFKQLVNQTGNFVKNIFNTAKKSVDNNVDFSSGFPSFKYLTKKDYVAFDGEITELDVSVTSGDVTVLTKDVEKTIIEATYRVYGGVAEENLDEFIRDNVVITLEDGELLVAIKSKRIVADITITLAESQLDDATFDVVNGVVKLTDLVADDLSIKKVNGDLTITGGAVESLNVKAVNGEVRIASDFETANISSVNGEILVTATSINAENLKVKNVNGDVKISVPENIGLVGYVKTTFGKYKTRITLDSPLEITKNGAALVRTATNSLTIDAATNAGTIWLKDGEAKVPDFVDGTQSEQTTAVQSDSLSDVTSDQFTEVFTDTFDNQEDKEDAQNG